jgi:hypothetical protein
VKFSSSLKQFLESWETEPKNSSSAKFCKRACEIPYFWEVLKFSGEGGKATNRTENENENELRWILHWCTISFTDVTSPTCRMHL